MGMFAASSVQLQLARELWRQAIRLALSLLGQRQLSNVVNYSRQFPIPVQLKHFLTYPLYYNLHTE